MFNSVLNAVRYEKPYFVCIKNTISSFCTPTAFNAICIAAVPADNAAALLALAEQIDGVKLSSLAVTEQEFSDAERKVSNEVKAAIEQAVNNIEAFQGDTPSPIGHSVPYKYS